MSVVMMVLGNIGTNIGLEQFSLYGKTKVQVMAAVLYSAKYGEGKPVR
nr:hypothetical protein [Rheinheimera sp. EpRS3]